ncbi:sigma-70 family RNA polymerase sigma factor [uncultured Microbacterium sp.]|uniref:sigma-70 family RNA polymerase sigma factor n=1 Tax=uncultured Microbacterium sp. TaxID=191216 RepID=UPI0028DB7D81|nr:sigma-70 family RNA polymerase sigma factor [uncultured Microbacterium sp.]
MTDALSPDAADARSLRRVPGDGDAAPPDTVIDGSSDDLSAEGLATDDLAPDVLAALVARAAAGDRDAAGEYFARMLPSLTLTARRIAGISHDADDLLGDAVLVVLAKWLDGTGPTENVPAYIAQIMRNRIRDDFRSPRSRVAALENVDEPASTADPRIRELEIGSELAIVRRALAELPTDQQRVLVATVLEGRKPRDLEEHMARPASAIYSLTRRAKGNLRRTTLRLLLEDGARPACVEAAQLLPETVGDTLEQTRSSRATDHYRGCPYCRRSWKRFAGLATLGMLPVAAGIALAGPADQASASVGGGADAGGGAGADPGGGAGVDPAAAAGVGAPTHGGAGRSWHDWARTAAMLTAAGTALVLVTILTVTFTTKTWFFAAAPPGTLDVSAVAVDTRTAEFDMALSVEEGSWTVGTLRIDLTADVENVDPPDGWTCLVQAGDAVCTTSLDSPRGGSFDVTHVEGQGVAYEFTVDGRAESGATLNGRSVGVIGG